MSASSTLANFQPAWSISYGGKQITDAVGDSWKEVIFEEVLGGQSSDLQMRFADPLKAMASGPPSIGQTVSVSIGYVNSGLAPGGTFEVDSYMFAGPPNIFTVKCLLAGVSTGLRTLNDFAYRGTTLTQIAQQVGARLGFTVDTSQVNPDVAYDYLAQNHESDLAFLKRIANQNNYEFQITGNKTLKFWSRNALDAQAPSGTIAIPGANIIRWRLKQNSNSKNQVYSGVNVSYNDPVTGTLLSAMVNDSNVPVGQVINSIQQFENNQQAQVTANAYLHGHNQDLFDAEIEMVGTMAYRVSNTVRLSGFGYFDNYLWLISKGRHMLNKQGYRTRLNLRITLTPQNKVPAPGVSFAPPPPGFGG